MDDSQLERLCSITLASLEMQLATLDVVGKNRMSADMVHQTMKLAQALLGLIENMEREFIVEIEQEAERLLHGSATLRKELQEVSKELPVVELRQELFALTETGHGHFTTVLSKREEQQTKKVVEYFAAFKRRVQAILDRLERM